MSVIGNPFAELQSDPAAGTRATGRVLRRALRMKRTRLGIAILLLLVLVALLGPFFAPHSPTAFVALPNSRPSSRALLGSDYLGQDVLSRFLDGGRALLLIAFVAVGLGVAAGTTIGIVAAYWGGALDALLMRSMDVVLAFPQIMLALVFVATVGAHSWVIVLAIVLTTAPRTARVTRGAAQSVVEREFVVAADALGLPRYRILFVEVLPNILSPLLVEASLRLTYGIGIIASLAFLGLAPNPNGANWGTMVQENQLSLAVQPWGVVVPILAIALLTIGTGLVGDGIARAAAGLDRAEVPA